MDEKKLFAFGSENDPIAWKVADKLNILLPDLKIKKTDNPDELSIRTQAYIIILDAARGIEKPTILSIEDLREHHAVTTHDIDLGMTLKLLKKAGKLDESRVKIIGIPITSRVDDELINNIIRLLKGAK